MSTTAPIASPPAEAGPSRPARRRWRRRVAAVGVTAGLGLALAACGGANGDTNNGVASLSDSGSGNGGSTGTTAPMSAAEREAALLKYTQCLREHGANVPDPQVDANGNVRLGGGGGPGGGGGQGTGSTIDRKALQDARKACGDPPRGAFGNFNPENQAQFQDAALKFAKCMRDQGVDMPDPDFSGGQGGFQGGPPGTGQGGQRRGPFGNLDRNDPKVQAAIEQCRSAFSNLPGGGPRGLGGDNGGGGGNPPANPPASGN